MTTRDDGGGQCQQQGCEADAVAIAHWPGQDTKQCEEHCRAMHNLSAMMGWGQIKFTDLRDGSDNGVHAEGPGMTEWRKVRKKPVEVEAWGPWDGVTREVPWSLGLMWRATCGVCGDRDALHATIGTLDGPVQVCPGDYIIRGVKSEVYPCKPDVFAETYEPAPAAATAPAGETP